MKKKTETLTKKTKNYKSRPRNRTPFSPHLEYIQENLKLFVHSICQCWPKFLVKTYFWRHNFAFKNS